LARALSIVNIHLMRAAGHFAVAPRQQFPTPGARGCRCAGVEALAAQHADFDLDHVQPTGMLGDVVELQWLQHPARFQGREGLIEGIG
jgi:hypothetical protein